jgi:hypothetical protein
MGRFAPGPQEDTDVYLEALPAGAGLQGGRGEERGTFLESRSLSAEPKPSGSWPALLGFLEVAYFQKPGIGLNQAQDSVGHGEVFPVPFAN